MFSEETDERADEETAAEVFLAGAGDVAPTERADAASSSTRSDRSAERQTENDPEGVSEDNALAEEINASTVSPAEAATGNEQAEQSDESAEEQDAEEVVESDSDADDSDADDSDADDSDADVEPVWTSEPEAPEPTPEEIAAQMDWYILKVQSNRENSIVDALRRRVAVAGFEPYFGEIVVPVEMVTEFKGGKKKVVKRKLYPGYIVVQMYVTEETWFLVRETPGVGDFTGAGGKPTPMSRQDVEKIRPKVEEGPTNEPRLKIDFKPGDKVKINDGTFDNFEGEVSTIDEASGRVTVMINIFGRSTPVELEYWQVEKQ